MHYNVGSALWFLNYFLNAHHRSTKPSMHYSISYKTIWQGMNEMCKNASWVLFSLIVFIRAYCNNSAFICKILCKYLLNYTLSWFLRWNIFLLVQNLLLTYPFVTVCNIFFLPFNLFRLLKNEKKNCHIA